MSTAYKICWFIAYPVFGLLFPCKYYGKKNIPNEPVIVCANHSNFVDPILVAFAFGHGRQLFFMAKAELFRIPVLSGILRMLGAFPVSRGESDINSIRTSIKHLKSGHQIMMFPEGTRVGIADSVAAKNGAVRIATKMNVKILPVYITAGKKVFRRSKLVIGEPYAPQMPEDKDFKHVSNELMSKIYALEKTY